MKTRDKAYHTEELAVKLTPEDIDFIFDGLRDPLPTLLEDRIERSLDKLAKAYEDWEYDYKK